MSVRRFSSLVLFALVLPAAHAQDPEPPAAPPPQPQTLPDIGHAPKRLFGFFPNFQAADPDPVYTHPTVAQKFKIARQNTFDPPNIFINAGLAMQAQLTQKGTGQFGRNFTAYYARAWADGIIGNYATQGALPSLLGEDPRYIRMGTGSKWKRTWHAVSQVAITKGTNGQNRVHLSSIAGNVGVVALTNLYYPSEHTGFGQSAARYGLGLGNHALTNLLTEFLPDIQRKLRRQ